MSAVTVLLLRCCGKLYLLIYVRLFVFESAGAIVTLALAWVYGNVFAIVNHLKLAHVAEMYLVVYLTLSECSFLESYLVV